MPIFGGQAPATGTGQWTALANFRAATTGRSCTVTISWYQPSGAASAIRASDTSAAATDTSSGWVQASVTAIAPTDAYFAAVTVGVAGCASSEVHYVDEISLAPGSSLVWTRGGLAGSTTANVQRSSDGGVTWTYVRGAGNGLLSIPTPSQAVTVYDYEISPTTTVQYEAQTQAVI